MTYGISTKPNGNRAARDKRLGVHALELKQQGFTTRQIAEALGKTQKQVTALVRIGERAAINSGASE